MTGDRRDGLRNGLIARVLTAARLIWILWGRSLELTRRAGREAAE